MVVSITPSDSIRESGDDVTVTLSYKMNAIMPLAELVINGPIDIQVDSTIRVE